MEIIHSSVA